LKHYEELHSLYKGSSFKKIDVGDFSDSESSQDEEDSPQIQIPAEFPLQNVLNESED
jgi:hypothetical protein